MKTVTLSPHGIAKDGEGVARLENLVVFVPFAVPGDTLEVELKETAQKHASGTIKKIINPSPERVIPPCPLFGKCGGCQLQHINYKAQLHFKEEFLRNFILHHGKFPPSILNPIIPAPNPWNYRNKIQLAVGKEKRIGLYAYRTHDIVDMEECFIQNDTGNKILLKLREAINNSNVVPYDETKKTGDLRHVLIKVVENGKHALIVLVSTKAHFPGREEIVKSLLELAPIIIGVIVNINSEHTNRVLGKTSILLWGERYILETIGDLKFEIGPSSFFQVHTEQIMQFYNILEKWLKDDFIKSTFDAYAGVGTFSLWLAKRIKKVTHIELSQEAAIMAKENAKLNNISNINICSDSVEATLNKLKKEPWPLGLLDPPRSGLSKDVKNTLNEMKIKKLIYISCNPATLIRDLNQLTTNYEIKEIQPIDLFPQTAHIEVMALLQRK